jgi:hypothetical protein
MHLVHFQAIQTQTWHGKLGKKFSLKLLIFMHQSDDEKSKANTNEIKTMSYHRDYLKKKAISLKSETFYESYKRCRKQVNRVIKEAKANYYKSKLENSNKGIARFFLTCLMDLISTLLQVLFSSITVAILANL